MLVLPTPDGGSVRVRISRRDFSKLIAGGALSSVFPGVTPVDADRIPYALTHPTKIDTSTLAYFRRVLAEHYSADKSLGPRRLLGPVLAQINVLDDLRRQTTTDHVDGLLGVLAQYAEMAGWLHQDLGLLDEALAWSRRAADWALVGGDQQMVAYMLVRKANIACLTGDHHAVVLRAAAARKTRDIDPKLTALAAQQEARGHSLLGDHDTAAGLLAEARALLDRHTEVSHPGAPVYLEHYDTATLEEQSAVCLRLAGDIDGSAAILQAQIASLGPEVVRDRGHLTAKLAVTLTHGRSPDPAHAAELGLEAIQAVRQTGSARILRELGDLDQRLQARWADLPAARDIHAALVA
ncbi:XRE family transcriptional regulator [Actinomadura harenae]|uniref:XRE family transcriptional regulator n=2 Tax=Actinomadura harenae TaxID=2483351 RepID=A0A3M2LIA2_9ACTN|nr:XRE family transcriptional regulator [Actinomadura harenae]